MFTNATAMELRKGAKPIMQMPMTTYMITEHRSVQPGSQLTNAAMAARTLSIIAKRRLVKDLLRSAMADMKGWNTNAAEVRDTAEIMPTSVLEQPFSASATERDAQMVA